MCWLTGSADSLISTVCNDIPIGSKHFPPRSSIIATQFRLRFCVWLTDWQVVCCLHLLTQSISSGESFDLVWHPNEISHRTTAQQALPLSGLKAPTFKLDTYCTTLCCHLVVTILRGLQIDTFTVHLVNFSCPFDWGRGGSLTFFSAQCKFTPCISTVHPFSIVLTPPQSSLIVLRFKSGNFCVDCLLNFKNTSTLHVHSCHYRNMYAAMSVKNRHGCWYASGDIRGRRCD